MKPWLVLLLALLIGGGFFAAGALWQRGDESDDPVEPASPRAPATPAASESPPPPVELVDGDALPVLRSADQFASISPSITTREGWDQLMLELSFGSIFDLLRKGTDLDPRPALDARSVNPQERVLTREEQAALDLELAPLDDEIRRARITRELFRYRALLARAAASAPTIIPPAVGLTAADVEAGRLKAHEQEAARQQNVLTEMRRAAGGGVNFDYLTTTPFAPVAERPENLDFLTRAEMRSKLGSAIHAITRADYPEPFLANDYLQECKAARVAAMREFIARLPLR